MGNFDPHSFIAANETVWGIVRLDLKKEPGFLGDLDIAVHARAADGQDFLFTFSMAVSVRE